MDDTDFDFSVDDEVTQVQKANVSTLADLIQTTDELLRSLETVPGWQIWNSRVRRCLDNYRACKRRMEHACWVRQIGCNSVGGSPLERLRAAMRRR